MRKLFVASYQWCLNSLYPKYCINCGREGSYWCEQCHSKVKPLPLQFCISCGEPAIRGIIHNKCKSRYMADQLLSVTNYQNKIVSSLIVQGKYSFLPEVYELLGQYMVDTLQSQHISFPKHALLCPIPLHPSRERWRGFNQSGILAETIAEAYQLEVRPFLTRRKATRTQKNLDRIHRQSNMAGSFAITPSCTQSLPGKTVIVIDDVTTTGATVGEAAETLKRHGAKTVICLTLARD
jgi:ComF family protein